MGPVFSWVVWVWFSQAQSVSSHAEWTCLGHDVSAFADWVIRRERLARDIQSGFIYLLRRSAANLRQLFFLGGVGGEPRKTRNDFQPRMDTEGRMGHEDREWWTGG